MSSSILTPRSALITGGTRGLGRALVLAFARRGYRVYATGRGEEGLGALASEASREALDVVTVRADVARVEDNGLVARRVLDDGGRLDVLVHNAGIVGERVELAEYPPGLFREVMDADVFGPFDLTRQALPALAPGAAVIFVSSGVGTGARVRWGAYNVAKIALEGLAAIWARELRDRGIRVFTVDPGPMRTAMRAAAYPEEDPATLDPPEARTPPFLWLAERAGLERTGERIVAAEWEGGSER
jgi:NAD(P)-dependent dehydrogenase (short-subunit alcohol dehydrogenase family)